MARTVCRFRWARNRREVTGGAPLRCAKIATGTALARVAGAALAMGNTLVVKPAEDASLSTIRIAELALEAGVPPGVFNVITGYGREAGAALSGHPGVDYVTFTGSPPTGTAIQQAAAINNRGVTMELGGKSPQIVFADADIEAALPVLVNAVIQNGGQTCSAGSRILIERPVYERVASALADRFAKLVGASHEADRDLGALINPKQRDRVAGMVTAAEAAGVPVLARGSVDPNAPASGYYFAPVLFGAVDPKATIAQEEVFGPVLTLFAFDDEDDAIRLANSTDFGLVAGIWTKDGARQHRLAVDRLARADGGERHCSAGLLLSGGRVQKVITLRSALP